MHEERHQGKGEHPCEDEGEISHIPVLLETARRRTCFLRAFYAGGRDLYALLAFSRVSGLRADPVPGLTQAFFEARLGSPAELVCGLVDVEHASLQLARARGGEGSGSSLRPSPQRETLGTNATQPPYRRRRDARAGPAHRGVCRLPRSRDFRRRSCETRFRPGHARRRSGRCLRSCSERWAGCLGRVPRPGRLEWLESGATRRHKGSHRRMLGRSSVVSDRR